MGVFQRFSQSVGRQAGSVSAQADGRAQIHRHALAAFTALISAFWIGPVWATVWFAAVMAHECLTLPIIIRQKIASPTMSREGARRWLIGITFWGCCVYAAGWVPSYLTGKPGSEYFAAVCVACAMIHAIVYTRKDVMLFGAYLAPTLVAATVSSFITYGFTPLPFVLMLVSIRLAISTVVAMRDRNVLFDTLKAAKLKREAAERASAAKTQFLATMSHELRTPLNAVIGYAEIVEEDLTGSDSEGSSEDVRRIKRAARGLLGLIDDVLDYSQLDSGEMKLHAGETNVQTLITEAIEAARPAASANGNAIAARLDFTGSVVLDGARLRQCVDKLLSNACKFTRSGAIRIEATLEPGDASDKLVIVVSDTGPGISDEAQERLFKPFEQAETGKTRGSDGAGLGLAIVARSASLMGGGIALESKLGAGSRFTLRIAAKRVEQREAPPQDQRHVA